MDVLNEVSFLKNVDKTPTFLVFNKRKNIYKTVDTSLKKLENEEDREELLQKLQEAINETIKSM
jgi:hypothetical protein